MSPQLVCDGCGIVLKAPEAFPRDAQRHAVRLEVSQYATLMPYLMDWCKSCFDIALAAVKEVNRNVAAD